MIPKSTIFYAPTIEAIRNPDALAIFVYLSSQDDRGVPSDHIRGHFGMSLVRYMQAITELVNNGLVGDVIDAQAHVSFRVLTRAQG